MSSSTNRIGIASGGAFSLFLTEEGHVYGSGYNGNGQLGLGNTTQYLTPQLIPDLEDIIQVSIGPSSKYGSGSSFFLKRDGTVYSCGYNGYGQLGLGDKTDRKVPTKINITDVIEIAAGGGHTLFLRRDGRVWATGLNTYGQLGTNNTTQYLSPVLTVLYNVVGMAAGIGPNQGIEGCSMFLKADGSVWGCGWNGYYQMGNGTNTNMTTVTKLTAIKNVVDLHITGYGLFLKADGTVWVVGINDNGALGLNNTTLQQTIVQATNIDDVIAISSNEDNGGHSLYLKADGTAYSCGYNYFGQLGLGNTTRRLVPEQVSNMNCIIGLYAGNYGDTGGCSFFLKDDPKEYIV